MAVPDGPGVVKPLGARGAGEAGSQKRWASTWQCGSLIQVCLQWFRSSPCSWRYPHCVRWRLTATGRSGVIPMGQF